MAGRLLGREELIRAGQKRAGLPLIDDVRQPQPRDLVDVDGQGLPEQLLELLAVLLGDADAAASDT